MYLNGVRIGMNIDITHPIHRQTRQDQIVGQAACYVVAAGATARGSAECRIAVATRPATGASTLASAYAFRLDNRELYLENR